MVFVTPAEPGNIDGIAALLEEMDRSYGATEVEPLELRVGQINDAIFSNPPAAYALLAWDGAQLVGLAAYSFLWPAIGLTRSLYLKELYVAQEYRRKGVGKLLMEGIFEVAAKYECSRVEWTTDDDNANAQRFYDNLGVRKYPSKVFYRVEGQGLLQAGQVYRTPVPH
ncbi:MAG TPA: GNAT family N-acetyltransferase [Actinomycetes bacterium]|nr:GNAT family N-acetyltransferase [Actinomycetes bacterium]